MTSEDDQWRAALAAIDRGDVTPEVERAVLEAARRFKRRRKLARRQTAHATRDALHAATGRVARSRGDVPDPDGASPGELPNHAHCYVCKGAYTTVHPYYHRLCVPCGDESYRRRAPELPVAGRRAILTGGRTKIGYRAALGLLRDGATVTVTTRYANDAARRFAEEPDHAAFAGRLRIVALDFRNPRAVHAFLDDELRRGEPLDILVNLAAQTIRSSPALEAAELARDGGLHLPPPPSLLLAPVPTAAPIVRDPDHGEWADNDARNSWDLELDEISLAEFYEVQLVNVFAPWSFTARLQPLLRASPHPDRYIVQVSAVEGQFGGAAKDGKHAHTNMAKAALHMLVRTTAERLAGTGIYMNAVDPGWVSDQSAVSRRGERRFCPPLDVVDGAARVLDPIARGLRGERVHGLFLKDFAPAPW